MGGGEMGVEWPHPAAFRPCFSPVGLSGLSPARAPALCRDGDRQKKEEFLTVLFLCSSANAA
ncbi:hypothetical protein DXB25_23760 [Lachnospiraceae bacterium OM02-31]|nr:hypothetical protein DXB25_23760 [Lachnospiraceae bacterium OM02-31]RJW54859.1 hypothetical protein DXB24_24230 [Lachnospiraceae bacterium OM02-3]